MSADPKVTFARIVGLASLQGLLSAAFWEILSFTLLPAYPITPFMGPSKEGTRILHYVKPSTNLSKDMSAGNRPNQYERSGLIGI